LSRTAGQKSLFYLFQARMQEAVDKLALEDEEQII
jgi:hypothetical protein